MTWIRRIEEMGTDIPCQLDVAWHENVEYPDIYAAEKFKGENQPISVVEILEQIYHQDFKAIVSEYLGRPAGKIEIKNVLSCLWQPLAATEVHIVVSVDDRNILLRYRLNLCPCKQACCGPLVSDYDEFKEMFYWKGITPCNKYLLPIIKDYDEVGKMILERYYPEGLEPGEKVSGVDLVERLGLRVTYKYYAPDSELMGQIFFDKTEIMAKNHRKGVLRKYPVRPGEIVLNLWNCDTDAKLDGTLVHECTHFVLNTPFYMLQKIARGTQMKAAGRTVRREPKQVYTVMDWAERQAEKMPAYIMMPESVIRQWADDRLTAIGDRTSETIHFLVNELAEKYKVSRQMAKIRLIELGYPEAEGVFNYLDDHYIPDYGCTTWKKGVTYTIPREQARLLMRESAQFAALIKSGKYVYVEGHFCLNTTENVWRSSKGQAWMTCSARKRVDECCLSFKVKSKRYDAEYRGDQAARKTEVVDKYLCKYTFVTEPGTEERIKENKLFIDDVERWGDVIETLPQNPNSGLKKLMELKGITETELSLRLGCSPGFVSKMKTNPNLSREHMVALCIACKVPYRVSRKIFERSVYRLTSSSRDQLMEAFLEYPELITVERANEILIQAGYEPLMTYMQGPVKKTQYHGKKIKV